MTKCLYESNGYISFSISFIEYKIHKAMMIRDKGGEKEEEKEL
jgi:hypothetical protein